MLTPKQQRFVEEYLCDLNGKQAAIRAGYKPRTAEVQASRLLRNAKVREALRLAQEQRSRRTEITADRVLQELSYLAFSDQGDILDFTRDEPRLKPCKDIPERARRALASVKVKRSLEGEGDEAREVEVTEFKLWDKGSALEKLGRHLGLFAEKHEHQHSGEVKVTVQAEELSDDELAAIAALRR